MYREVWEEDRKNGEETASFSLIEVLNDADALFYGQWEGEAGKRALIRTGGVSKLYLVVNRMIIRTQISSIIMAAILVILVVSLMFRSLSAGLLSVVPLLLAILVNFGMMGFTGTRLDLATAIIASVAIGIGVDYAIHFLNRFHHVARRGRDFKAATAETISTSGRAIIFNMISVAAGFLVLCFSNFPPLQSAGWLIALTMLTSSLGALTLLPTLLNIFRPKFLNDPVKEVTL
jgi:predicted RND superfamily exporter protein